MGALGVSLLPEPLVYLALGGYISLYLRSRNTSWNAGAAVNCSRNDILAGGIGGSIVGVAFLVPLSVGVATGDTVSFRTTAVTRTASRPEAPR